LGMTAGVKLAPEVADTIIIPSAALTELDGKTIVWVIDDNGIANPREVIAGQFTEYGVPITSGLARSEMIAIAGVHTLIKGQKVKPIVKKIGDSLG